MPQSLAAVRDVDALQKETGVVGEVDVVVEGDDLTDPKVIGWMRDYQDELLTRHGYSAEEGCGKAALCPALSLPNLFRTPELSATREQVRALLDAVPPYFSQAAITPDRKTAVLAFGLRLQSLEGQREVIEDMRARLRPPDGVRATVAGLPVLAADANHAMSDPLRRALTALAGLLAVALALFAVYRSWTRAWVPLVPIALATGWSALVLWLVGVPLNPMSAALSALVIAISTEFSVLLSARFREEREAGFQTGEALARTYGSTGAAVLASGVTAIAGFAVLIASDIAMLRDFGLVTVIDLSVSLLGRARRPAGRAHARRAPRPDPAPAPPRRRGMRRTIASAGFAGDKRVRCMGKPMRPGPADRRVRGRAAHVDHVQHDRHRVQGLARPAGGRHAAAGRDAAVDVVLPRPLRRQRGDRARAGSGRRAAGLRGARP